MARQTHRRSTNKRTTKSNQKKGQLPRNSPPINVTISHIGGRGDGVGKAQYIHNHIQAEHDIFVPSSLPGERLSVQPLSLNTQGIKARIIELHSTSPDRQEPRCEAFPACGGCRFQHWEETAISKWKQNLVIKFLNQVGVSIGKIKPFYQSPLNSRRRASFHLKRLSNSTIVGFREHMGQHIIAPIGCVVLHPALLALQVQLQQFASVHFPAGFAATAYANLLDQATGNSNDENICLYLEPIPGAQPFTSDVLIKLSDWAVANSLARLSVASHDSPMTLFAPEVPMISFGKISVSPPPGTFLQATRDGEALLQAAVAEIIGPARQIVDLFAGCGTLSLPLLDQVVRLLAVEQNVSALSTLKAGADAAGLGGRVRTDARNLFDDPLTPNELTAFDKVIIDPPRSGAAAQCHMLAKSKISTVAMVSCNPSSFARDAAILADAGFKLNWVQVVDQFLFSNHLEIVGAFDR